MARPLLIVGPLADLLLKAAVQLGLFDEAKHPRQGKGSAKGGQFAPKGQRAAPAPAPAPEPTRDDTRSVEDYLEEARLSTASGGEGGPETRQEMQDILKEQQEGIASQIRMEVAQLQPIARVSDTALVFGVRPRNGILFSTPAGTWVFAKARCPTKAQVDRWYAMEATRQALGQAEGELNFGTYQTPNTVIGNYRVVEHGQALREQGLLNREEDAHLTRLEDFWAEHPELDRDRNTGVWMRGGRLRVEL